MSGLRRRIGRLRRAVFVPSSLTAQLDQQRRQIEGLTTTVAALKESVRPIELDNRRREIEHGRVKVQVGVLEERMGALEEQLRGGSFVADDASLTQARSLVDEIRHEHQQVRVRMQLISHYEERLRRVEEALAGGHGGDPRHPV